LMPLVLQVLVGTSRGLVPLPQLARGQPPSLY